MTHPVYFSGITYGRFVPATRWQPHQRIQSTFILHCSTYGIRNIHDRLHSLTGCIYLLLKALTHQQLVDTKATRNALRQNKPPPIRRIRISDFGLPDPKRDPDRHQNCITWSLSHALPSKKFRQNPFTSLRVIRRTDRQTNKQTELKT